MQILPYAQPSPPKPWLNPLWAVSLGTIYSIIDIHLGENAGLAVPLVLLVLTGIILGAFRGWVWFPIIGICVFAVHVLAIETHYTKPPYVESKLSKTVFCFVTMLPAGVGAIVGLVIRSFKDSKKS